MPRKSRILKAGAYFLALQLGISALIPYGAQASTDPILGAAGDFQIVSGAAISIGGAVTGLDTINLSSSTQPVNDLQSAITSLSAAPATTVPADLGGATYLPGTYAAIGGAAFSMTTGIILDGQNDCTSKFIFITPAAMNTTAGISITLINGAKPNNVYFVIGGAITVGASNKISGNFLSSAAITIGASSTIDGRFLGIAAVTVGASVVFMGFPISGCSLPAGSLSISVPESVASQNLNAGETLTIEMGQVVVTDTRGVGSGAFWTVSAQCSTMSDGHGHSMSGENLGYSMKDLNKTSGLITNPITLTSLVDLSPVLRATEGPPSNSASWTPLITVSVPHDQFGSTYTGVIVHSVY
jgi:hypothetical protein